MTAQSPAYIKNTLFNPTQAAGAITPTRCQDIGDSFVPWDDPGNAQGLGAPAIVRGTVSTYNLAGYTSGTGLSTAVRTANATALQNAINKAASQSFWFEMVPGTYEIYSSTGLVWPWNGFCFFRGRGAYIQNFYTNAPVMTFGDPTGANQASGFDVEGPQVGFGVDQTGQTNAIGIVIGPMWLGKFSQLLVEGLATGHKPYIGISVVGSGTFFSNRLSDLYVIACQKSWLNIANQSTQNVWQRLHLTQGGFSPTSMIGPGLQIYSGGGSGEGSDFDGVNFEHAIATGGQGHLYLGGARGINMRNVHVEDCGSTGVVGFCQLVDSSLNISGLDLYNHRFLAADGFTAGGRIFDVNSGVAPINIDGFLMQWTNGGCVDQDFSMFSGTTGLDSPQMFMLRNFNYRDFASNNLISHFSMDGNLNKTDYPIPSHIDDYRYGALYSRLTGALTGLGDQNFTHYGQSRDAFIWFPAGLSADRTLTLSNNMRSTSPGATVERPDGDTVTVYRGSGTATHNLIVKDNSGATLTTNSTAATQYTYVKKNGANFVAVT